MDNPSAGPLWDSLIVEGIKHKFLKNKKNGVISHLTLDGVVDYFQKSFLIVLLWLPFC